MVPFSFYRFPAQKSIVCPVRIPYNKGSNLPQRDDGGRTDAIAPTFKSFYNSADAAAGERPVTEQTSVLPKTVWNPNVSNRTFVLLPCFLSSMSGLICPLMCRQRFFNSFCSPSRRFRRNSSRYPSLRALTSHTDSLVIGYDALWYTCDSDLAVCREIISQCKQD